MPARGASRTEIQIYLPCARGQGERSRMEDPIESFAMAGTTFGAAVCTEHEDTDALVWHCRSRYQEFTDRV